MIDRFIVCIFSLLLWAIPVLGSSDSDCDCSSRNSNSEQSALSACCCPDMMVCCFKEHKEGTVFLEVVQQTIPKLRVPQAELSAKLWEDDFTRELGPVRVFTETRPPGDPRQSHSLRQCWLI